MWMKIALAEAGNALERGEVPVGAVIIDGEGKELGRNGNRTRELSDGSAHAELLALREAERGAGDFRLDHLGSVTCVVTVEPCLMCLGALSIARVERVVFGIRDEKFGGLFGRFNLREHPPFRDWDIIEGVMEDDCLSLMQDFFRKLRA